MPEPIRVGAQGRLVIPASLRRLMGIHAGDELIPVVEEGRLILATREALLADLQAEFAAKVPPDVSLSEELLAERREEAQREDGETERQEARGPDGAA